MRIVSFGQLDVEHPRAGARETYRHEVLRRWAAAGHEVVQFTSSVTGAPNDEVVDGIHVVRRGSAGSVHRAARRSWQAGAVGGADLVIDEIDAQPFGAPRWATSTPVVALALAAAGEAGSSGSGRRRLRPYRATAAMTTSEGRRRELLAAGLQRVAVVPARPELVGSEASSIATRPTVLVAGRPTPGEAEAIRSAIDRLRAERPELRAVVVDSGPLGRRPRGGADVGFVHLGRVDDAGRFALMRRADAVLVVPGTPQVDLVVREAAAVGTPSLLIGAPGSEVAGTSTCPPEAAAVAEALGAVLQRRAAERRPLPRPLSTRTGGWDAVAAAALTTALRLLSGPELAPAHEIAVGLGAAAEPRTIEVLGRASAAATAAAASSAATAHAWRTSTGAHRAIPR